MTRIPGKYFLPVFLPSYRYTLKNKKLQYNTDISYLLSHNFDFYPLKNTTIKNYRFYGPGYTLHLKRQLI